MHGSRPGIKNRILVTASRSESVSRFRVFKQAVVISGVMCAASALGLLVGNDSLIQTGNASTVSRFAPAASATPQEIDFGEIEPGSRHSAVVTIRNDGRIPFRIGNIMSGCGCTVAKAPVHSIEPGMSVELPVQFDAPKSRGRTVRKQMTVVFDNTEMEPLRIPISCTTRAEPDPGGDSRTG